MRLSSFRWATGVLLALIGAMMLVVPHQFASPVYAAIQPSLSLWGLAFLAIGLGLVAVAVFRPSRWVGVTVHLLSGIGLLVLAYGFAAAGAWTGTSNWAVLGLASVLALLLRRHSGESDGDGTADLLP